MKQRAHTFIGTANSVTLIHSNCHLDGLFCQLPAFYKAICVYLDHASSTASLLGLCGFAREITIHTHVHTIGQFRVAR